jgi:type IV secretion system protein VirD4
MHQKNPVSLYLVINPQDADRLRPLTRIVLQLIGKKLTAELGGYKHRLLFLIDEFPTLGRLEFFETQLAFFAGYGIKCALIAQSFNQLYKHYSKESSIADNCKHKLLLGVDNPAEAKLVSDFLGSETLLRETQGKSGKLSEVQLSGVSISKTEVGRTLMTPDEILRLPFDEILFVSGGMFPYRGKKIMYFQDERFKKRANLAVPESKEQQIKELFPNVKSDWQEKNQQEEYVPVYANQAGGGIKVEPIQRNEPDRAVHHGVEADEKEPKSWEVEDGKTPVRDRLGL